MNVILIFLVAAFVAGASANCGCLKCSKHLSVISPPGAPCKVIIRGPPCRPPGQPLPYTVQVPLLPPTLPCGQRTFGYRVELPAPKPLPVPEYQGPLGVYEYQLQAPLLPAPSTCQKVLTGLSFAPDRIVLPAPECPSYQPPTCYQQYQPAQQPIPVISAPAPSYGPIIQPLPADFFKKCGCRYGSRAKRNGRSKRSVRTKRDMPLLQSSVRFLMDLLPKFIKLPIQHTLKTLRNHHRLVTKHDDTVHRFKPMRPFFEPRSNSKNILFQNHKNKLQMSAPTKGGSLLQKLHQLNQEPMKRHKRELPSFFKNSQEMILPFFRVTDVESSEEGSSEEDEEAEIDDEDLGPDLNEEYLRPLNFNHMIPHNPIYYLLNTPIRLLHHFHKLGEQISPVFKSMPQVFVSSKKYLRDFGKHLKNDVLNFASNFIGDFDDFSPHRMLRARHRRSIDNSSEETKLLEPYEPDYSLAFQDHARRKRYILKVVDEDEVQEFLKEKLGGLVEPPPVVKPEISTTKHKPKKRLVVEKLKSKIVIDNKGRPFLEINGVKRPLFLKRKEAREDKSKEKTEVEEKKPDEPKEEDITDKINGLIEQVRSSAPIVGQPQSQQEVPLQIVKDKIKQVLEEIQTLINMDTSAYWKIHNDLYKLQHFKDFLVEDWKKILIEAKDAEVQSKVRILDDFKEMQALKDDVVKDISVALNRGNGFMTKKLIKMLVRLQKLQCVIYKVVEDFGEHIKMGTSLDRNKEIKYIDFLSELRFVLGQSQHDLENELKNERDVALENEMKLLSNLKKMLESGQNDKMHEEAKVLWEIKNVEKLQKDAIKEIEVKLGQGQKIRKELKILFDLLRQLENCEEKQAKLFEHHHHEKHDYVYGKTFDDDQREPRHDPTDYRDQKSEQIVGSYHNQQNSQRHGHRHRHHKKSPIFKFPPSSRTIIEDKKPVKLVTNGYTLTGYKVTDDF